MDHAQIAREFLVALRGRRSQVQWSRRLGYKSNVAYTWEAGRRYPTAAETMRAAARTNIDLGAAFAEFYGATEPTWLDEHDDLRTPGAMAAFLDELRGGTSITDLARRAGISRYSVSRWLSGQTQPRLPDFFRLIESASLRLVDFVTCFVDPHHMPSILPIHQRLEARRTGAFEHPWTQAVLRCVELEAYRALPKHQPGWMAARLGIEPEVEQRSLDHLMLTGQLTRRNGKYQLQTMTVDTRRDPRVSRHLKAHWASVGVDRIRAEAPGQFSYNVFGISAAAFERIRQLHLAYYYELRGIVDENPSTEHVAVANIHLFMLDPEQP